MPKGQPPRKLPRRTAIKRTVRAYKKEEAHRKIKDRVKVISPPGKPNRRMTTKTFLSRLDKKDEESRAALEKSRAALEKRPSTRKALQTKTRKNRSSTENQRANYPGRKRTTKRTTGGRY